MDFFYPNFQNDMWRIFGLLFYGDKDRFFNRENKTIDKEGIQKMLSIYKVGIGETATEVVRTRDNASDKYLEIVTPVDLGAMLAKIPECNAVITTGEKAASVIAGLTSTSIPRMGEFSECTVQMPDGSVRMFRHWRMPSSSRAYPMSLEKKAGFYANMFRSEGVL